MKYKILINQRGTNVAYWLGFFRADHVSSEYQLVDPSHAHLTPLVFSDGIHAWAVMQFLIARGEDAILRIHV